MIQQQQQGIYQRRGVATTTTTTKGKLKENATTTTTIGSDCIPSSSLSSTSTSFTSSVAATTTTSCTSTADPTTTHYKVLQQPQQCYNNKNDMTQSSSCNLDETTTTTTTTMSFKRRMMRKKRKVEGGGPFWNQWWSYYYNYCKQQQHRSSNRQQLSTMSSKKSVSTSSLSTSLSLSNFTLLLFRFLFYIFFLYGSYRILWYESIQLFGLQIKPNKRTNHEIQFLIQRQTLLLHKQQHQEITDQDILQLHNNNNNEEQQVQVEGDTEPIITGKTTMDQQQEPLEEEDFDIDVQCYQPILVVIMNHSRPKMIQHSLLLPTLLSHPCITTLYLCHSNIHTMFVYEHEKVININATITNELYGLALRFYYCSKGPNKNEIIMNNDHQKRIIEADNHTGGNQYDDNHNKNNHHDNDNDDGGWVIHVDDDMELDYYAINTMIHYMKHNPNRIVGYYGRSYHYWKVPHRYGYDYASRSSSSHNKYEVILTKIFMSEKKLCHYFVEHALVANSSSISMTGSSSSSNEESINRIRRMKKNHTKNEKDTGTTITILDENSNNNTNHDQDHNRVPLEKRINLQSIQSMVYQKKPYWNGEDIVYNLLANFYYSVPPNGPYTNMAIYHLTVWENKNESLRDTTNVFSDISGNMERHQYQNVGLYEYIYSLYHSNIVHARYRGYLWYRTKQLLYNNNN